jgi:hypothetical protein
MIPRAASQVRPAGDDHTRGLAAGMGIDDLNVSHDYLAGN